MNKQSQKIVIASLFSALICICTLFIKVPAINGYYHIGDALILLSSCILPFPYAAAASAIGAGLADLLSGYAIYILPTAIIKPLMIIPFKNKSTIINKNNILSCLYYALVLISGYYIASVVIITNSFTASLATIIGDSIQSAVSIVLFIVIGLTFDRTKITDKIKSH